MPPLYDFKCKKCERIKENVLLRITHTPDQLPICCDQSMRYHITTPPLVHWTDPVIEPFRAIATKDMPIISTTRENREYMARNNLIDANELGAPPSHEDQKAENAGMQASIDAISPDTDTAKKMDQQGMFDITPE